LNITITELPDGIGRVALDGRLDAAGADAIGVRFTAATAAHDGAVIVDLSGVSFIASLGLRLLISSARALHQKGSTMVLFGATDGVRGVLLDSAVDQLIACVDDEPAALARLAG
jgi:anti-anti-sigma factor